MPVMSSDRNCLRCGFAQFKRAASAFARDFARSPHPSTPPMDASIIQAVTPSDMFSWLPTRFPLHIRSPRELTLNESPIIAVVGKAFWDIGRAPKDQSNRRKRLPQYAVWEIYPMMALHVDQ